MLILACARHPPNNKHIATQNDVEIKWCTLDITSKKSIIDFASLVQDQCPDGVDVLINNAGVNLDTTNDHGIESARQTIQTNYDGTASMMQTFMPLMRHPALPALRVSRIVNVSSVGSKLSAIPSNALRKAIRNAGSMQDVQALRTSYLASVTTDNANSANTGWPSTGKSYCVSKALINAATQVLAAGNPKLLINACCPGWCQTDMGSLVGPPSKSAADGARIPLKLAFGPVEVSGRYWENASVHDTGDGRVAEWYVEGGL